MTINGFRLFFKEAGVKFTEWPLIDESGENKLEVALLDAPAGTHIIITVLQTHFLFTEVGNFIGVLADEMGTFEPKIEAKDGYQTN